MKRKNILLSLPAILACVSTASADWTLISDFNAAAELDKVTDVTNQDGNAHSEIIDGKLAVFPGNLLDLTSNLFAMVNLGVDLKVASETVNGPVTVYLEVTQPTVDDGAGGTRKSIIDIVWGLSNADPDTVTATTYNSFNVMQRINFGNDTFETRDGGSYVSVAPFTADVSYKIWLVVDFTLNVYQAYVQGGTEWPTQTQVIGEDPSGYMFFRQNPEPTTTVDYLLVALSRGNAASPKGPDPAYVDNVAVDLTGTNLTPYGGVAEKGPGYMGNYDVVIAEDGQKWVDSGAWLGWVNVENYPVIYILSLENWAYIADAGMTGDKDSTGAWIYQFR